MKGTPSVVAFSLVEVLVALAIIAFAVMPIVDMGGSSNKKAAFSEFHAFFQVRAMRVIERYSVLPYEDLVMLAGGDGVIQVTLKDPPIPNEFRRKLKSAVETLEFKELEPGLGRLTATMQWAFPMDPRRAAGAPPLHRFVLSRLVSSSTRSLRARKGLEL